MEGSIKAAYTVQVASAAEVPEAKPAEERTSQEAQQVQPAALSHNCADAPDATKLDLHRRLRLLEGPAGAEEPAAGLDMGGDAGHMNSRQVPAPSFASGSSLGQSAQQLGTLGAWPSVLLPAEESANSENVHATERTPSSADLPSPHLQREALSPLLGASNFRNQPAASQVHQQHPLCLRGSQKHFITPHVAIRTV